MSAGDGGGGGMGSMVNGSVGGVGGGGGGSGRQGGVHFKEMLALLVLITKGTEEEKHKCEWTASLLYIFVGTFMVLLVFYCFLFFHLTSYYININCAYMYINFAVMFGLLSSDSQEVY